MGMLKVKDKLESSLRRVPGYLFFIVPIDPRDLGQPMCRPRLYIIAIRKDCLAAPDVESATEMIHHVLSKMQRNVQTTAAECLLPNSHELVQAEMARRSSKFREFQVAKASGKSKRSKTKKKAMKWVKHHKKYSSRRVAVVAACPSVAKVCPDADQMLLTSPRQRDAWEILRRQHLGADLVVDLSQSLGRQVSLRGILQTLTPRAEVAVASLGRSMLAVEKLMALGFPVHKMGKPAAMSDAQVSRLGGNAMHVRCVGAALVLGLCLVNMSRWQTTPEQLQLDSNSIVVFVQKIAAHPVPAKRRGSIRPSPFVAAPCSSCKLASLFG